MQYEHRGLESNCVNGSIRTPIPILRNLQNTGGPKPLERLGLRVLLPRLSEVKSKSKQILDRLWQGLQIPLELPIQ
jgi:hypothetical protein